jgi:RNA polymerase sigma-70 factor, ECF subfamily
MRGITAVLATIKVMGPDPASRAIVPAPAAARTAGASDDRDLVAAVLRRDRKAAAQLVAAHVDAIHAYVRHRVAPRTDIVDDLVQDVFLAALGNLHQFAGTSSLRAWLFGVARHKVEDHYRKRLREPDPLDDLPDEAAGTSEAGTIEETIDRARALERTRRVLSELPERYAVALRWRYWEKRSVAEIASETGRSEKAAERLLARARGAFRRLWVKGHHG